jgi:hypothetical protein
MFSQVIDDLSIDLVAATENVQAGAFSSGLMFW